jgi:taurine dioxygenase
MMGVQFEPLSADLPFGVRITGMTAANVDDADLRAEINAVFDDRGVILFSGVEETNAMQTALSQIFGSLQGHALDVPKGDDATPGLFDIEYGDVFEVDGEAMVSFVPWHFDACYTKELNRGGILRGIVTTPEGGLTCFADGVQLYQDIAPDLRSQFEGLNILYQSSLMFWNMKFGRPKSYNPVKVRDLIANMIEATKDAPRSVHPAIWQRKTGEKVLHVSPWQAAGIEGMETPDGDELLEALCQEIAAKAVPYRHKWRPGDMVIWDNWRFIHAVTGHSPEWPRKMLRTTINGDYGLGRFENNADAVEVQGMGV